MFETFPDSQFTTLMHSYFPGQQIAIGWSYIIQKFTWFWLSLDNQHFNNCIIAAWKGLICFSFLDVYQLNFAILSSDIHQVILKHRSDKRTYHCVVLDDSFQKHRLNNILRVSCNLPNVQRVVKSTRYHLGSPGW